MPLQGAFRPGASGASISVVNFCMSTARRTLGNAIRCTLVTECFEPAEFVVCLDLNISRTHCMRTSTCIAIQFFTF